MSSIKFDGNTLTIPFFIKNKSTQMSKNQLNSLSVNRVRLEIGKAKQGLLSFPNVNETIEELKAGMYAQLQYVDAHYTPKDSVDRINSWVSTIEKFEGIIDPNKKQEINFLDLMKVHLEKINSKTIELFPEHFKTKIEC